MGRAVLLYDVLKKIEGSPVYDVRLQRGKGRIRQLQGQKLTDRQLQNQRTVDEEEPNEEQGTEVWKKNRKLKKKLQEKIYLNQ